MNKCVFYIDATGGLVICGQEAPYILRGSSFCKEHITDALIGRTWEESDMTRNNRKKDKL